MAGLIEIVRFAPCILVIVPMLAGVMIAWNRAEGNATPQENQEANNGCGIVAIIAGLVVAGLFAYAILTTAAHWGLNPCDGPNCGAFPGWDGQ